jgi:hypothetical protein
VPSLFLTQGIYLIHSETIMQHIPHPPEATLAPGEKIISLTSIDGRLYSLTSAGRILQAQLDWTWVEVPGPGGRDGS